MLDQHNAIVVTGGSTGIGAAICQRLLDTYPIVINLSRRPAEMNHPNLINISVDLSDREATQAAAKKIAEEFSVSGFVHNAGLIRANLIEDVQLEDLDYLSQVHLGAAITLTQAFVPQMKANTFGRVVLITSRAALGLQTRTSYSATKAGMMAMARTWALELGEFGITVNTVAPGPIQDTEMFAAVVGDDREKIPNMANSIPVKRLGKSIDVANAVDFFMSPEAGFVTGQTLMVCGGASLGSLSL